MSDVKEQLCRKTQDQTEHLQREIANYEEKICNMKNARLKHHNVLEKVELVLTARERVNETRVKEVADKIQTKLVIAEKNKAELAEKAKKTRQEQVIYLLMIGLAGYFPLLIFNIR